MPIFNNNSKNQEDFLSLIGHEKRGKLKVYLGSAAGVGKTCAMLSEGHHLRVNDIDVVIGYLEPHERPETIERAKGLEEVSVRIIKHDNLILKEMDLDAVIMRHPQVVLVDEFAHTNAPGSKNQKRYQDIEELLNGGINVITTLNIQHLESLYDTIEQTTGIKVRERIPDSVLAQADQIINVDLEAEDLIERLQQGKIYKLDKIDSALSNFFSLKNLTRLREIALSETANLLDKRQRQKFLIHEKPSALNKVMVRISGAEIDPEALLRRAVRFAAQLNAEWYVIHILTIEEESRSLSPNQDKILKILETARAMGAQVILIKDENIPNALIQFAKANGITHLIQGHPGPRKPWFMFQKSISQTLIENLPDVHIIMV